MRSIKSQLLKCAAFSHRRNAISTQPIYRTSALIGTLLLTPVAFGDDSTVGASKYSPSEQEVLRYIADTIDWYRHLPSAPPMRIEAGDLLFLEDNQPITKNIVRLSFEFGKAIAAIHTTRNPPGGDLAVYPRAGSSALQDVASTKRKLDANTQETADELKSFEQPGLKLDNTGRKKRDMQIAEARSRLETLRGMSANYQELLKSLRTATQDPDLATDLGALVDNLERSVPDVSAAAPPQTPTVASNSSHLSYDILGLLYRVSALSHKGQIIDGAIDRTGALMQSLQTVKTPLELGLRNELSGLSLDSKTLSVLQEQQYQLTNLTGRVQATVPAIGDLAKQQILLNVYSAHLSAWRAEIKMESNGTWKSLLIRLAVLAAIIATLLAIQATGRKFANTHFHNSEMRQALLIGERVLFWLMIVVVALFAFAVNPGSVATFFGLLAAGLAVGLHDVLLAIGGYLMIVRMFRVRVGDRIQIAGVTGEVAGLGLMQFRLKEIDIDGRSTGREVFIANSYVFVSPATPLFRGRDLSTG